MKILKISNFAISRAKQFSKSFIKKKAPVQTALPIVTVPLVVYNLKGDRDVNLTHYCNEAISKLKEKLKKGDITQSEYNSHVKDIKDYYNEAKKLPADVSSSSIKQGEPSFKGDDSDYSVYNGDNDDGCCDCGSDDDCCDSDSDCDSGDAAVSSC